MRKRDIFWVVGLLLAAGAWFYFGNHGKQPTMIITASLRPPTVRGPRGQRRGDAARGPGRGAGRGPGRGGADNGTNFPVLFELLNPYKLTSLKVTEVQTNKGAAPEHILWHLVSTNGSDPVKTFFYGRNIQGMAPYLPGINAEPLSAHVEYRLDLEAGNIKGSTVFQTVELAQ